MKLFAGLNVWMLPLAAVLSFAFGGLWYGLLSKPWLAALGKTQDDIMAGGGPSPRPFIITFLAQLVMAWVLAGLILHLTRAGIPATVRSGMITAALVWLGFVLAPLVVNHQFQMQKPALTAIDGGHWLGVLLIQGAILGLWGVA